VNNEHAFGKETDDLRLATTLKLIRDTYLGDARPWVLGYSGGKDSTCTLQLVLKALASLPAEAKRKPIYVLSSDTLVESPVIVSYITDAIRNINALAQSSDLPISASIVQPAVEDSFWVNLVGKGYPAPYSKFRWCTDRLKISPANRFIKDQVAKFGEVVLILGVRKSESTTRAQVMATHEITGSVLRTHSTLNGALVFAPIADWSTDDVWSYLLQNSKTQWGSNNNDLAAMYRTADGECPLVVDTSTPSCGNSRFGCWVCTVVTRDKSMEAMIDAGEAWMEDLLSIRDFLAATQEPKRKKEVRSIRKTDGRILLKDSGDEAALGPYKLSFCKEVLTRLLTVQEQLPKEAESFEIISQAELLAIRRVWRDQRNDWEDSVPQIYKQVTGKKWFSLGDENSPSTDEFVLIEEVSQRHSVPPLLLRRLLDAERRAGGLKRRVGIYGKLSDILDEDWRSEDEVTNDIDAMRVG
jgi:DNA sulfur modification protein DndC